MTLPGSGFLDLDLPGGYSPINIQRFGQRLYVAYALPDGSGGWVSVGVPRIIALTVLNGVGISTFNSLPVMSFALNEQARSILTTQYDFNLATNFRPERDYMANIRRVSQPVRILAGVSDEVFQTAALEGIFRAAGKTWEVELLPGIGHIELTLQPTAILAIIRNVETLQHAG